MLAARRQLPNSEGQEPSVYRESRQCILLLTRERHFVACVKADFEEIISGFILKRKKTTFKGKNSGYIRIIVFVLEVN